MPKPFVSLPGRILISGVWILVFEKIKWSCKLSIHCIACCCCCCCQLINWWYLSKYLTQLEEYSKSSGVACSLFSLSFFRQRKQGDTFMMSCWYFKNMETHVSDQNDGHSNKNNQKQEQSNWSANQKTTQSEYSMHLFSSWYMRQRNKEQLVIHWLCSSFRFWCFRFRQHDPGI